MNREYERTRGLGESTRANERDRAGTESTLSRRNFLRTTAVAGASALALGVGTTPAAAAVAEEDCGGGFGEIAVEGGEFVVINNDWSAPVTEDGVEMCTYAYDDGSYGWEWDRANVASNPNYPQVLIGTKPWGDSTATSLFPIRRGDVEELTVDLDVDLEVDPSAEWNFALEWWLTEDEPGTDVSGSITHEIMLVLEHGEAHDHGAPLESGAITDAYGNEIDYWVNYAPHGDEAWSFHIFRIAANRVPDRVELNAITQYLDESVTDGHAALTDDLWLSGIDMGNEYWPNTSGSARINRFDATVNGQTASSGSGETVSEPAPDPGDDEPDDGNDGDGETDGSYPTWDPNEIYREGDRVGWDGSTWEAQWWTENQEPGTDQWGPWTALEEGSSDDGSTDDGATDDGATDDGSTDEPTDDEPGNDDSQELSTWSPAETYTEGDRVSWVGSTWRAKWWTQGQEPGASPWGPWEAQ